MVTMDKTAIRKRVATRFVKAFDKNDTNAALDLMVKQPVWEFAVGNKPHGGRYAGAAAVRKAMDETWASNPGISYKTIRSYASGNNVIHEIHVKCKAKKLNLHALDIFTFNAANKIVSKRTYRKVVGRGA